MAEPLGVWLKRLRANRDLTQELLAEQACCAAQTIRMIESGRRRPSREMAERLADVLDIPAEDRTEFLRVARSSPSPASDASTTTETRLPFVPNALIGRDDELATILRLLTGADRVVSIVGPGGAGKTRLAIEAARSLEGSFSTVGWVDLAPLSTASQFVPALSRSSGVSLSGAGRPVDMLIEALRDRDVLLVLDNLEHLLGPDATNILQTLLSGAPRLKVLITSRIRPQLPGEQLVILGGLATPAGGTIQDDDVAAVRLFVERASHVDHHFVLAPANWQAVAAICREVGGMPLALELAAASLSVMSPAEVAAELVRGLDVLTGSNRSVPERQRGPRVVFDHSWRLLGEMEQHALARLSVFRGGWSRDAAGVVAGATLPVLSALVDASLVRSIRLNPHTTRYTIHELVRQYAAEQLEQDPVATAATRLSHARYFATLLGQVLPDLQTAEQAAAVRRIEPDLANIHAAWEFALAERNVDLLRTMAYALTLVHEMRGTPREAVGMLEAGVTCLRWMQQQPGSPPDLNLLHGQILTGYGWLLGRSGNVPAACDVLSEAVAVLSANEDVLASTPVLGHLGLMLFQNGRFAEARDVLERGIGLLQPRNSYFFLTLKHVFLSFVAQAQGDLTESQELAAHALDHSLASGSQRARVLALTSAAISANERGDAKSAMEFIQEGIAVSIANRDRWGLAFILTQLGEAALHQGDLIEAGARLRESIDLLDEIGEPFNYVRAIITLGRVEYAAGNHDLAREIWSDALRRARSAGIGPMAKRAQFFLQSSGVSAS